MGESGERKEICTEHAGDHSFVVLAPRDVVHAAGEGDEFLVLGCRGHNVWLWRSGSCLGCGWRLTVGAEWHNKIILLRGEVVDLVISRSRNSEISVKEKGRTVRLERTSDDEKGGRDVQGSEVGPRGNATLTQ